MFAICEYVSGLMKKEAHMFGPLSELSNRLDWLRDEVMIIVGSWNKYPLQVIVAVIGIVITLAYLFRMMRGLFYGPMDQKYSHSHDAVAVVDRLPLLIMIVVSIGFGLFPMHMYNVVRSGVDPLVAKITLVHPVSAGDPAPADLVSSAAETSRGSSRPVRRPE